LKKNGRVFIKQPIVLLFCFRQLATELLRTHGNAASLTMTREQFLKYYRLASTQHPVHVRKDLEQLGYEVFKLVTCSTAGDAAKVRNVFV